jgi:hypothetical protein
MIQPGVKGQIYRGNLPNDAWFDTMRRLNLGAKSSFLATENMKLLTPRDVVVGDIVPLVLIDPPGTSLTRAMIWAEVVNVAHDYSYMMIDWGKSGARSETIVTDLDWRSKYQAHICTRDGHQHVDLGGLIKSWCKHCNTTLWYHRDLGEYCESDPFQKGA